MRVSKHHHVPTYAQSKFWAAASFVLLAVLSGCASFYGGTAEDASELKREETIALRDLHCPIDGTFVATGNTVSHTGEEGVALYSLDHGATWRRAAMDQVPPKLVSLVKLPAKQGGWDLFLSFYEGRSVFSRYNQPGQWWHTVDEGQSWKASPARLEFGSKIYDFDTSLPRIVVLDNDPLALAYVTPGEDGAYVVMRSTDAGKSWQRQTLSKRFRYAHIVSDGRARAALHGNGEIRFLPPIEENALYWSDDGGATWIESQGYWPHDAKLFYAPTGALVAFNANQIKYGRTLVAYSKDYGRTFEWSRGVESAGRVVAIDADKEGRLVGVTEYGYVLISDDSGGNWRIAHKFEYHGPTSLHKVGIAFLGEGVVVILPGRGLVMRSVDRGENWRMIDGEILSTFQYYSAHCSDDRALLVAAGSGVAIRSADGGMTWQRVLID